MRQWPTALLVLWLVSPIAAADDTKPAPNSPVQTYKALIDEFEEVGGAKQFAARFFAIAEHHPNDPVAVDALVWVVKNRRTQPDATRAIELLQKRHLNSQALSQACRSIARSPSRAAEQLLRRALEKSPHTQVRALACFYLADLFERQLGIVGQLKKNPELAKRVLQYYGKDYGKHLTSLDTAKLEKELEQVYERMAKSFADAQIDDEKMGPIAEQALFRIRRLSVGRVAPEIEGEDIFGKEFKLSGYRGKVVVLSFWGHW